MQMLGAVFLAEIKRYYRLQWSHLGDSLSWFAYTFLMFAAVIAILNGVTGGGYGEQEQLLVMVGWLAFVVASDVIAELPGMITEEVQTGTLEQICLAPLPLAGLLALRSLAFFLGSGVRGILALVVFSLIVAPLQAGPEVLLIFAISLIGAYGLGFALAGVTLVFKRAEALVNVLLSLMIFLTGAFVSLEPIGWLYAATRYLLPFTWGIELLRAQLTGAFSSSYQFGESLLGLGFHSGTLLIIGLVVLYVGMRSSQKAGSLAHY